MATTFGERLRKARKDAGHSGPVLAKHLKVSAQTVSEWERDKYLPTADKLVTIARLTNVKVDWLLTGQNGSTVGRGGTSGRLVPVIPFDDLSSFIPSDESAANTLREKVFTHFPCGNKSFAISIRDNSNSPRFESGDSVIIDPDAEPRPGDMVLAIVDGEPVFRRFRPRGKKVELSPLNSDWDVLHATLDGRSGRLMGTMVEHATARR